MSVADFSRKLAYYPRSLLLRAQIATTRALLRGSEAWHALDRLGVPGHGTDLVRIDFPPRVADAPRWQRDSAIQARLAAIIDQSLPNARAWLSRIAGRMPDRAAWPEQPDPARPGTPNWTNDFLTPVDMATLYGVIRETRPARYIEIGSGMSTRVAHAAKTDGKLATEIISIDPWPRIEVEVLCDRAIRTRLEDNTAELLTLVRPGDVVFLDGSHRAFPGSDVTVFFLDVLPALPPGCIIHIHDIYLPDDYPTDLLPRLWSEQYMLASWLLGGGAGVEIILPCAALCLDPEARTTFAGIPALRETNPLASSSMWLRRADWSNYTS
jgi:hypothetical protein